MGAGERKQVFAEYVAQRKKREKEEEREKKKNAKDDFVAAVKNWEELKVSTRYRDVAEKFMDEDWFKLIDEEERDELFQDFMDEYEKNAKEDRRKKRKEYVEMVKKVYKDHEEITLQSRWRDVQDLLRENETFRWLSKLEALTSWEEWVTETEKEHLEKLSKAKFRHERTVRDKFRELLEEQHKDGRIKSTTAWRDVAKRIQDDERYIGMIATRGSTPHDLYDDFLEGLGERYKEDSKKIKKWAKAKGLVITSSSTFEWFNEQLKDEEGYAQVGEDNVQTLFDSLVAKAKEQDEDAEKSAKRNRKRFVELLQKTREVTAATTYEAAGKILGSNSAWEAVDEHTRRQCFDIFVGQLKIQSSSRKADGDSDEDDDRHRKDAKKRRKDPPEEEEPPRKAAKTKRRDERDDEDDELDKKKHKKQKR